MSSTAPDTPTGHFSLAKLFGVHGQTVVVTGGGSGLGSYAALALALQGAKVYVVGRRKEKLQAVAADFEKRKAEQDAPPEAKDGQVIALPGDLTSKEAIKALVEAYGKLESHLDVLINAAGVLRHSSRGKADKDDGPAVVQSLWDEEWDEFSQTFDTNLFGLHFATLAFAPFLAKAAPPSFDSAGPSVINIASIAGLHLNRQASISYQTSKDAVIKLGGLLAGRFLPLKIRVNTISPGLFPSEMVNAPTASHFNDPKHPLHGSITSHPLRRSGTPEDFAGLVIFLSSRAGAYLNNAHVVIDGGRVITQSAA